MSTKSIDSSPAVDLIIAAHDPEREVGRAVASVLDGAGSDVRVTVVAHGKPASDFSATLADVIEDSRVRVVEFADGVRSPAGPFNHGFAIADAEFVAIMGSDDFLEPGAITAWLARARETGTDYLMPQLRNQDGAPWRDPLTRPRRHDHLDVVRDRLAYRAAPLGLIRRSLLRSTPLTEGLATGEDIDLGLRLVAGESSVAVAVGLPAYVIGADAPQRITLEPRAAAEELRALLLVTAQPWILALSPARRRAMAIKLWRLNLIPGVVARADAQWSDADLAALATSAAALRALAPTAEASLSASERWVADAAAAATGPAIIQGVGRARAARPLDRLRTRNPLRILGTDTPVRRLLRVRMPA